MSRTWLSAVFVGPSSLLQILCAFTLKVSFDSSQSTKCTNHMPPSSFFMNKSSRRKAVKIFNEIHDGKKQHRCCTWSTRQLSQRVETDHVCMYFNTGFTLMSVISLLMWRLLLQTLKWSRRFRHDTGFTSEITTQRDNVFNNWILSVITASAAVKTSSAANRKL